MMVFPCFLITNNAKALTSGDFTYTDDGHGFANVTGYSGGAGTVDIPAVLGSDKVTGLAVQLFYLNTGITALTIEYAGPGLNLGDFCLYGCTALTTVTIKATSVGFGQRMFFGDTALTDLYFNGVLNDSKVTWTSINYNFYDVPGTFRVHALTTSNFPLPGDYWTIGLESVMMGTAITAPILSPSIISTPPTSIGLGLQYAYFPVADQGGGVWTMTTNATWLSMTGYPAVIGISPMSNSSFWVHIVFTNANGVANQNYTLNVTGAIPNGAADAWLSMTPDQSLLATLMAAGVVFILITYLTLRRRSG